MKSGEFDRLLAKKASGRIKAAVALRAPRAAVLILADPRAALMIWNLESGDEPHRKEFAARDPVCWAIMLSADGHHLAAQESAGSVTVYAID